MVRVTDTGSALAWLSDRPAHEASTGYAPEGWAADTWVLPIVHERRRRGARWRRVTWASYLARPGNESTVRSVPPCFRWFEHPVMSPTVRWPEDGTLDPETFASLIDVLARSAPGPEPVECVAFWGRLAVPHQDGDRDELWTGPLSALPDLVQANGGPYRSTPTNFWAHDRSWFVWSDHDLMGTRVSGSLALVDAVRGHPELETVTWPG